MPVKVSENQVDTSALRLSIGIVAYNEEKYLPALLENVKQQTYPHALMEIVLIDSGSTDRTREIMENFRKHNEDFYSVLVLENPARKQAAGWNVGIRNFTGDVFARIDAHTKISPDYSKYVMEDICGGESVVGGVRPCLIEKDTPWANVLLQVENSLFGSSINASRRSQEKQYVKTMFHAAYKREVFEKVGFFNENLLRTEDNEMHYRIREAGFKLCYDPRIVSYQYARSSFSKMLKQKYANGYWIGLTLKVCPKCLSLYHLIPFLFIAAIVFSCILAFVGVPQLCILLWALYGLFAVTNMVLSAVQSGFYKFTLCMPFLFLILHVGYGVGTLMGLLRKADF